MGEGEAPEDKVITDDQKHAMLRLAKHFDDVADQLAEPVDPKVEAFLRMAADCLKEQVILSKYYPYDFEGQEQEPNSEDFLFLTNSESKEELPSADELQSWFDAGANNDTGDSE